MIDFKHSPSLVSNASWCRNEGGAVMVKCPYGHIGALQHDIDRFGIVRPSVICPHDDCSFHNWIRLADWTEI